jgi:hypothetical protein
MTWHTNLGERVLEGVEAKVYLTAVQHSVEYLQEARDFDEMEVSIDVSFAPRSDRIFDTASIDQKIVLLHTCLSALLKPEIEAPALTNVIEAAAYFPFAVLKMRVEDEIFLAKEDWSDEQDDEDLKYYYRHLVWKAFEQYIFPRRQGGIEEFGEDEEIDTFHDRSENLNLWRTVIDELAASFAPRSVRIFWDRDWQIAPSQPQASDAIDESSNQLLGLDEYFTNRLPPVSSEQVAIASAEIESWQLSDLS